MRNAPILVDNRESLIYLLSEAAEIEHGLMCSYLYAAFSLRREHARWTPAQAQAVALWRAEIMSIAREEMLHLSLVCNLLNAIGGAPHLARPNFPVWDGYHPSGVSLKLAPFCAATLDHFVFMERPAGSTAKDGAGFDSALLFERKVVSGRLVPSAQDFDTVGHLYRGILDGFTTLAAQMGPRHLFIGNPALQLDQAAIGLPRLLAVTNLASAEAALEVIVTQGEGLVACDGHSHFSRFSKLRDAHRALLDADPDFSPAWPAATHPVMRVPVDPQARVHVVLEPAAALLDLCNACYSLMLRALEALLSPIAAQAPTRAALAELCADSMRWMTPVAERLAQLPANPQHPGVNAGMSFTTSRSQRPVADRDAALLSLAEGCDALARRCHELAGAMDMLPGLARQMVRHAQALRAQCVARPRATATPLVASAAPVPAEGFCGGRRSASPATADASASVVEVARGRELDLHYEGKRCIHARHCVLGAPKVFLANTPGEWIRPDAAPVHELMQIAHDCPSGAITYVPRDPALAERAPEVNSIRVRENGPLAVHADLRLPGLAPGFRATLCRCGRSSNKPYCDGSHNAAGFAASGEPPSGAVDPLAVRNGPLEVTPLQDGPLRVVGNLELCAGTGRSLLRTQSVRLCRCGHSRNKPLCDGSHSTAGFSADGA